MLPAWDFLFGACCVAHLYVLFAIQQTSPPSLLSKGEEERKRYTIQNYFFIGILEIRNNI
jgi:hypothetical protein